MREKYIINSRRLLIALTALFALVIILLSTPASKDAALSFAGEPVPVEREDVKQKFDKQLAMNHALTPEVHERIARAVTWKPVIVPILKKEGIPEDFFYLAVAESFLENATSHAGAKGFWQFMRPTAVEYGLVVNGDVDERLNPEKSTKAAAKYLKKAKKRLGSWTLAAASYNMGMHGLNKAVRKQQTSDFYSLKLNTETGAYIYRILALKTIMENHEDYGYQLDEKRLDPAVETWDYLTRTDLDLNEVARAAKTDVQTIKVLNPWIKGNILKTGGKSFKVKVPVEFLKDQAEIVSIHRKSPPAEIYW